MSQPRKSTRKKRQTQLSFSPLPSSSPAVSQVSEQIQQIQQRAALVRYDTDAASPTKKRRVGYDHPNKLASSPIAKSMFGGKKVIESPSKKAGQLPTPAASSQLEGNQAHTRSGMFKDRNC